MKLGRRKDKTPTAQAEPVKTGLAKWEAFLTQEQTTSPSLSPLSRKSPSSTSLKRDDKKDKQKEKEKEVEKEK